MNVKVGFRMSKFGPCSNVKIVVRMSKCDIPPEFECQNRISNVKIRYIRPEHVSFNRNMYIHVTESQSQNLISTIITLETLTCFEVQKS